MIAGYVIQAALYPWHEGSVCQITPPPTCRSGWQVGLYPIRCRMVIWIWTLPFRCWNNPTNRAQPALLVSSQVSEQERSDEAISLLRHARDCFAPLAMTTAGAAPALRLLPAYQRNGLAAVEAPAVLYLAGAHRQAVPLDEQRAAGGAAGVFVGMSQDVAQVNVV